MPTTLEQQAVDHVRSVIIEAVRTDTHTISASAFRKRLNGRELRAALLRARLMGRDRQLVAALELLARYDDTNCGVIGINR